MTNSFLGVPIQGTIVREGRKTQRPREEFEPLVKALLDDPFIDSFGWRQYTPYFNDGDTCIFGAHGFWVRTVEDVEPPQKKVPTEVMALHQNGLLNDEEYRAVVARLPELDDDDDGDEKFAVGWAIHPTLGGTKGYGEDRGYEGTRESQWRAADALATAVEGGAFDAVLLDLFGDHCEVKVSRTGIVIESYEHD